MDMIDQRRNEIVAECERQSESCLYTSTALFSMHKQVRLLEWAFTVIPIALGSLATLRLFTRDPAYDVWVALFSFGAGIIPAIYKALRLDISSKAVAESANTFKGLQDRFRQASRIGRTHDTEKLEGDFLLLMEKMDKARMECPSVPDWHFKRARKKIKLGHYEFGNDLQAVQQGNKTSG